MIIAFEGGLWLLGSKNVVGCCVIMGKRKLNGSVAAGGSLDTTDLLLRTKLPYRTLGMLFLAFSFILLPGLFGCTGDTVDVAEPQATSTATLAPQSTHTPVPDPTPTPSPSHTSVPDPIVTPSVMPTEPGASTGEVRSDKERITDLAVPDSDMATLVVGNSAFAFDLYHALREEGGNLFYSPYSISVALAMTFAGARAETERQMAETLHYRLSQEELHPALNALDLEMASREKDGEGFRLNIANAIWGQSGYEFNPEFLDVLALNYGAGLRPLNFAEAPEESRTAINDWVAERTEERIKDLIPQGAIDWKTRLALTNAIYFNAAWHIPFQEGATRDRTFHLLDGAAVETPMMTQTASFGYLQGDGYQAIDLLYMGEEMSMTLLVPDENKFSQFEAALDAGSVGSILKNIRPERLDLTMPLFDFESQVSLKETLKAMGMQDAFSSTDADFSGMDGRKCTEDPACLIVTDVFHKGFVSVDEEGTEASAATGVLMGPTSMPPQVTIDRPFIFLIRDIETEAILFVGRVVDPST